MNINFRKTKFKNQQTGLAMWTIRPVRYSVFDEEAVTDYAVHNSNINRQELMTGFAAIRQAIDNFVLNGHNIIIDGLGCFYSTVKTGKWDEKSKKWVSAGAASMDGVSNANIKNINIRFRPCTSLREKMRDSEMQMIDTKGKMYQTMIGKAVTKE